MHEYQTECFVVASTQGFTFRLTAPWLKEPLEAVVIREDTIPMNEIAAVNYVSNVIGPKTKTKQALSLSFYIDSNIRLEFSRSKETPKYQRLIGSLRTRLQEGFRLVTFTQREKEQSFQMLLLHRKLSRALRQVSWKILQIVQVDITQSGQLLDQY